MSEDYLAPKPIAMWNTVRGVWEKPGMVNLFCEHSELFSETWPSAGTMRNGMVWKPRMPERLTEDSESLFLLRTPAASEAERGHQPEDKAKARGGQVTLSGQFMNLPTPTVADTFTDQLKSSQQKEGSMHSVNLSQAVHMMPTPSTMDDLPPRDESKIDYTKGGYSNIRETVVRANFGRFEPVVKRWEAIIGHTAPEPTEPTGKDGAPRLSSKFTEWMMGLEPGWITGVGLSRKDELRACGNGVVPQQAMLALKMLKARFEVQ